MNRVRLVMIGAALGFALLLAFIVLSSFEMSLWKGLRDITDTLWGITTLIDVYLGFFAAAAWIAWRERRAGRSVAWFIALCMLGNLALMLYILLAGRKGRGIDDFFRPGPR